MCKTVAGYSHPCSVVKLCWVNKDDKNVGTVSEGVFSGREFPSVKLSVWVAINGEILSRTCQITNINTLYILMFRLRPSHFLVLTLKLIE